MACKSSGADGEGLPFYDSGISPKNSLLRTNASYLAEQCKRYETQRALRSLEHHVPKVLVPKNAAKGNSCRATAVANLSDVRSVSVGYSGFCATTGNGELWCAGQLGDAALTNSKCRLNFLFPSWLLLPNSTHCGAIFSFLKRNVLRLRANSVQLKSSLIQIKFL